MDDKSRRLSLSAFSLCLAGFILPILCWSLWWPHVLLFAAGGAEFLAFILGSLAWRRLLAKIAVAGSVNFCLLAIWLGSQGLPTYQLQIRPTASWMRPLEAKWVLQSPAKSYSVQTDSGLKRNGEDSLRFELRGGERWVDQTCIPSFRSEVEVEEDPPAKAVKWYSFSVFFPANFPVETNRLVFAQWHGNWHFLQPARIPSAAFRFVNGRFSVTLRHSPEHVIRDPDAVPAEELFKKSNFHTGRWHDFVVQAKWSCKEDGFFNVWWNGKQIVQYHGPVGYDDQTGPQFKFGLYRDATDKTYVAYFNHVKSGDSPQEVDFDPSTASQYSRD